MKNLSAHFQKFTFFVKRCLYSNFLNFLKCLQPHFQKSRFLEKIVSTSLKISIKKTFENMCRNLQLSDEFGSTFLKKKTFFFEKLCIFFKIDN